MVWQNLSRNYSKSEICNRHWQTKKMSILFYIIDIWCLLRNNETTFAHKSIIITATAMRCDAERCFAGRERPPRRFSFIFSKCFTHQRQYQNAPRIKSLRTNKQFCCVYLCFMTIQIFNRLWNEMTGQIFDIELSTQYTRFKRDRSAPQNF